MNGRKHGHPISNPSFSPRVDLHADELGNILRTRSTQPWWHVEERCRSPRPTWPIVPQGSAEPTGANKSLSLARSLLHTLPLTLSMAVDPDMSCDTATMHKGTVNHGIGRTRTSPTPKGPVPSCTPGTPSHRQDASCRRGLLPRASGGAPRGDLDL